MLNIPSSVKTLFQTDGVRKNFRVIFPNGELNADFPNGLTNDNVTQECLHFTESLCSQSTFKFGLAEASVLEFETVGVANMYGMTIEAGIEIDISSLSAAQISAIESGTYDGTLVKLADSDLGYGFYRVPLGTFRIESCPRDHQSMAHRKVTAYTVQMTDNMLLTDFELRRSGGFFSYNSLFTGTGTVNLWYYLYSLIGCASPAFLANSLTKTVLYDGNNMTETSVNYEGVHTSGYYFKFIATYLSVPSTPVTLTEWADTDILGVDIGGINLKGALKFLEDKMEEYGVTDVGQSPPVHFTQEVAWNYVVSGTFENPAGGTGMRQYESVPAFYPFYLMSARHGIKIPKSIEIWLMHNGDPVVGFRTTGTPKIYQYTPNTTLPTVQINVTSTAEKSENNLKKYSFDGAFTPATWLAGILETNAQFCGMDRLNGIKLLRLNSASPVAIGPSDYSECWWDEYDFEPIGTVTVTYTDSDEKENTADVSIGNGASRYDMTSNDILKQVSGGSLTNIKNIITTSFKPYARTVEFTPTDMTMQGWPWLEAGDALRITAEDGTVIDTYALRVEMSGIQNLMAVITAQGGEIIGEA